MGLCWARGFFWGKRRVAQIFEHVFKGVFRYAVLNTLGSRLIPPGVGGERYLLARSRTKQ